MIPPSKLEALKKAGYRILGKHKHSAVKVCHWTKRSLLGRGVCYKEKFYAKELGIRSHRCIQITPSLPFCDHRCVFCWRDIDVTSFKWCGEADDPAEILDSAIVAQRVLLSGFGGNPNADKRKLVEAREPRHCAISLAGEPTLYPKINGLIQECERRRMTSFLVTNGQHPEILERLVEPTQLYISVVAPDPETYASVCQPLGQEGWERLDRSLELMSSFTCRRVIRLTLVRGLNLKNVEGYAKLIEKAGPDFVEPKGYFAVGYSRARLGPSFMPSHAEIKAFGEELARLTGYAAIAESEPSRVLLLKAHA
jgi:tRNA wybutosine-synthesizing protein 1